VDCCPVAADRNTKWNDPSKYWIKINVDASFVQELNECSIGCIARDNEGTVIWKHMRAG
jgi:hypothetical protein